MSGKSLYPIHNNPIGHHIPDAFLFFHFGYFTLKSNIKRIATSSF